MKPKRCGNCGSTKLKESEFKGKPFPFGDYPAVMIEKSAYFLQCQQCGEILLSNQDVKKLSQLLRESVASLINAFIDAILAREHCKQSDIASHLGVSPEYLSEIKSGRKLPRFQTFNFLKTLAYDPASFAVSEPSYLPKKAVNE